ncbi:MAG TPA: glycosyltransferase [Candidatus Paceibacterota bacterium]
MAEKNKIKVCYLITKGVWGGAQKYVYNLATTLPKDKYDVSVICGEGGVLEEKLKDKGIEVHRIKSLRRDISILGEIKSFFVLLKLIWKLRPDVLHLNSSKAGGIGALIGRVLFVPKVIFTAHGFAWNEERKAHEMILIFMSTYLTILFCHKTVVINSREKKQVENLPLIKDGKVVLVRNGIEKIDFLDSETSRKYIEGKIKRNLKEVTLIGTIAELHKNKGLTYAISGLSKIDQPFVFIIFGEGEERKKLEKIIHEYKLQDKVYLCGFTPEASKYIKAFDIFLLTSIKEGLPYTILEAGLAKVPIISTSVGGIGDIIDSGKNGILITVGKPGEVTRAVEYLTGNKKEAKEFGKKLGEKIEKEFSIEEMLSKTEELYN